MAGANPGPEDAAADLARMAGQVARLLAIGDAWPPEQRAVLEQLKDGIDALHREGLVRLIRVVRSDPGGAAQLRQAVQDPFIFGLLRLHGIVREPLEQRVQQALDAVAPLLASHGGGVELVAVLPPDTVQLRLTGNCQGCASSGLTLAEGVERSIRQHAPEVLHVVQVSQAPHAARAPGQPQPIRFVSPFARADEGNYADLCALDDLPESAVQARQLDGRALLLYRQGDQVSCFDNACAHLGQPLDGGPVEAGVLTCPHHGFRFDLSTGECLDVGEVQLVVHAVRVQGGRVAIKT
jgi:nitrite reductase/ring-hydroxylating ferredoxin subunit/Fe-S cluster biogenesis protein NfuA